MYRRIIQSTLLFALAAGSGARLAGFAASPILDVPRAAFLGLRGWARKREVGADTLATLEPLYVRDSDAKLPSEPLRLDAGEAP